MHLRRHCEERSDEANQKPRVRPLVCFASLAMTGVCARNKKKAPENRGLFFVSLKRDQWATSAQTFFFV